MAKTTTTEDKGKPGVVKAAFERLLQNFVRMLFCLVEIALGAGLFYAVVWIIKRLHNATGNVDKAVDPALFWFVIVFQIALLMADAIIVTLFVSRGVKQAWEETWGSK